MGATGAFDLVGWVVTLLTLAVSGVISGWAGATPREQRASRHPGHLQYGQLDRCPSAGSALLALSGLMSGRGAATRAAGTRGAIADTLRQAARS